MKKEYVVGFVFDSTKSQVLLIKKERPEWQKGRYNGIGGLVESNELSDSAMTRECKEECGLEISDWILFAIVECPTIRLYYFKAFVDLKYLFQMKSLTDEEVIMCHLYNYSKNYFLTKMVQPSSWILLMALDDCVQTLRFDYKVDSHEKS